IPLKLCVTPTQQPLLASLRHLQCCSALIELKRMMLRSIGFNFCAPFSQDLKIDLEASLRLASPRDQERVPSCNNKARRRLIGTFLCSFAVGLMCYRK